MILARMVLAKLEEQVDRAAHLMALVPPEKLDWRPDLPALRLSDLLKHLTGCLAGVCAAVYAAYPEPLGHFERLRGLKGTSFQESHQRFMEHIREGFALITDQDLARPIPTVFVPEGEPLLTLLLGNIEHFINHKYQLFFYLKMLGVAVSTPDLYQLRGTRR